MNVIFMGTPEFGAVILDALAKSHNVSAVVTQPDKPVGRGHKTQPPPVKKLALALGIPALQPERVRSRKFIDALESYGADVIVVAAYGKILPKAVLDLPRFGCVCVHASLLPKYRGAAPIQWAIINGETETGVSIMRMDEGIDTGDVVSRTRVDITPDETYGSLYPRLAQAGAAAVIDALKQLENGAAVFEKQGEAGACYAPMIKNETCVIDWNKSDGQIINLIRALNPEPGAVSAAGGIKIWKAEPAEVAESHKNTIPGEIIYVDKRGPAVKTAGGAVLVTELQAGGGKKMPAADYLRGHSMPIGLRF